MFDVCRTESQQEIATGSSHSSVDDASDTGRRKFNVQIVSANDAQFENLLSEAVVYGNQ